MKLALCLTILIASSAWAADEAADRASIEKVVSTLSNTPDSPGLFTADFADQLTLQLLEVTHDEPAAGLLKAAAQCDPHQVWGESNPCVPKNLLPSSRFAVQSVRWITPDVALVDALNNRTAAGISLRSPVVLLLRKEKDVWRIAGIRELGPTGPPAAR